MPFETKRDSSLVVGMNLVRRGESRCVGFSREYRSCPSWEAQVLRGQAQRKWSVLRLRPLIPTKNGGESPGGSAGANVDARPSHLLQFAKMGSIYMEHVVGIKNPRVGIVNIGAEEEKRQRVGKRVRSRLS